MTISDFLTFFGILTTVFFGYLVTHYHSVRDARTRVLKDSYIEQIKAIKGRVDQFFHRVAFGKSSCKKVVQWYSHISIDIKSIDDGVRKALDLQIDKFSDVLDYYYSIITSWEDYNNQYAKSNYWPNSECRESLLAYKNEIDNFLNDYIDHINQANNYPIWTIQKRRISRSVSYYKKNGSKRPLIRAILERIEKHIWETSVTIIAIIAMVILCFNLKHDSQVDLETPLKELSAKQDSIYNAIHRFEIKYEPVQVLSKEFNNSSFFSADKIDSVQVTLYQVK